MGKKKILLMTGLFLLSLLMGIFMKTDQVNASSYINIMIGYTFDYKYDNQTLTYEITSLDSATQQGTVKVLKIKDKNATGTVNIPSNVPFDGSTYKVTEIGDEAFFSCNYLTEIQLPATITRIGNSAFQYCTFTSFSIPSSVIDIGKSAFSSCDYLTQVNIPNGVKQIRMGTFNSCNRLTSVEIQGATTIGLEAFSNCHNLTDVVLPESITRIGGSAFFNCDKLTNINIPVNLKEVGDNAFYECNSLTNLVMPEGVVTTQSERDFEYEYSGYTFEYEILSDPNDTTPGTVACKGNDNKYWVTGNVIIPKTVVNEGKEYIVTEIADNAFYGCSNVTSVTLPDSITRIGNGGFYGCGMLSINLPDTLTYIGDYAFSRCKIKNFIIPNGITKINNFAFSNNYYLESITIPKSVTEIGNGAFYGSRLYNITIPDSVTKIGQEAFKGSGNLNNVTIPDSVTEIGASAFGYCYKLTTIKLPQYLNVFENGLFQYSPLLNNIQIPSGVNIIGKSAFIGCTGLVNIQIPNSVATIGDKAFQDCANLKTLLIPQMTSSIGPSAFTGINKVFTIYKDSYAASYLREKAYPYIYVSNASSTNIPLDNVVIKQMNIIKNPGAKIALSMVYYPNNTTANKSVKWTSSNKLVATVDSTGTVTAVNMGSAIITATVGTKKTTRTIIVNPKAPTSVKAVSTSYNSIKVSWLKVDGVLGYRIYRARTNSDTFELIADVKDVTYTDTKLDNNYSYSYKVYAYSQIGDIKTKSKFSQVSSTYLKLSKPTTVKAEPYSSGKIKVSWSRSAGADGYYVYRATSATGTFSYLGKCSTYIPYIDSKVTPGKTYYYKVRAYNYADEKKIVSSFTTVVKAKANP